MEISESDKKAIAAMVVDEMENRRRRRMDEAPLPAPPKRERHLCLVTVMDHGVGFPSSESRAVLEKCFYAWATFRKDSWVRDTPDEVAIVALGDGRKLPVPLRTVLLAGIVSCVQVENQALFGADPLEEPPAAVTL